MIWNVILYGFLPLLIFAIVDSFANLKWAVISALALAVVDIFISYYYLNDWDPGLLVALLLLFGFGYLTFKRQNPLYVKLQPVVMGVFMALLLVYYQFFSEPIVYHYLPLMTKIAPPEFAGMLTQPEFLHMLNRTVTASIFAFLLHAAWLAYAALYQSKWIWLLVRGLGFWLLLLIVSILARMTA